MFDCLQSAVNANKAQRPQSERQKAAERASKAVVAMNAALSIPSKQDKIAEKVLVSSLKDGTQRLKFPVEQDISVIRGDLARYVKVDSLIQDSLSSTYNQKQVLDTIEGSLSSAADKDPYKYLIVATRASCKIIFKIAIQNKLVPLIFIQKSKVVNYFTS